VRAGTTAVVTFTFFFVLFLTPRFAFLPVLVSVAFLNLRFGPVPKEVVLI
jgi:hypothetical protein